MRTYKKLAIVMAGAMMVASSYAELVASLHQTAGVDILDVDVYGPGVTRTTNGNANTQGTLEGAINFQAATSGQFISDIRGFSGETVLRDLNRYASNSDGGSVVTFDYDFTGQSSAGGWNFHLDFSAEGAKNPLDTLGFFISYNDGGALSLDTSDIKTATLSSNSVIDNASQYVSLLALDPTAVSGVFNVDITAEVNDAIANGGGIRITFVDQTFRNTVKFFNDSGIQAIPEPATIGMFGIFGGALFILRRRVM